MTKFLRPRLSGDRFNGGSIPLDMLSDLSVLGEMVVEVAKWRYLEAHPDRDRSPRGFADRVSFKLIDVEDGSAIPVIEMSSHPVPLPGMSGEYERFFVEAFDAIGSAISAAERDEPPTNVLPEKYLGFFDRIGRGLREGESIEFPISTIDATPRLTIETRRRLLFASHTKEITQQIQIRCQIPEVDQDRMTFELQLPGGRKVNGSIREHHLEVIMQVFNEYREQRTALIQGFGKYDQQDRLINIVSIEDVIALDELDVPSRLDDLRSLNDGWFDGEGEAPKPDFLDWLSKAFVQCYPDDLPLPYIYPSINGGVQAEWSLHHREASLAIDPCEYKAEWHVLDVATDTESIDELDLANDGGWLKLVDLVRLLSQSRE